MIKTASEFLALASLKKGKVKVRDQEIHFRELSVSERGRMLEVAAKNSAEAPAWLVAACVITPDGAQMFTEDQAKGVAQAAPEVVDAVAVAIMRLSGIGGEDSAKNG